MEADPGGGHYPYGLVGNWIQSADGSHPIPLEIRSALVRVLSGAESPQCIWHPLGFLQIKLARVESGHLKIHIWPPGLRKGQSPSWPVHRHIWPVFSSVLVGPLVSSTYLVEPDSSTSASHRLYDVTFDGDASILTVTETGTYNCTVMTSDQLNPGDFYSIPITDFHATDAPHESLAVTAIFTPPPIRRRPKVVGDSAGDVRYEFKRQDPSSTELKFCLETAIDGLAATDS